MRPGLFFAFLAAGMAPTVAACGGSSAKQGAPLADRVAGHTYVSTQVTGHTLFPGTRVTLSFGKDATVGANAGCNSMSGPYTIDNDVLVVTQLAQTQMGCVPAARQDQDTWLAGFLTGRPHISLDGTTLHLTQGSTALTLVDRKVAEPDKPLTGTTWVADTMIDGDTVATVTDTKTTLRIEGTAASGKMGCNSYGATVAVSGDALTFRDFHSTRIACPYSDAGTRLSELLGGPQPVRYAIDSSQLTLTRADGKGLGFHAAAA